MLSYTWKLIADLMQTSRSFLCSKMILNCSRIVFRSSKKIIFGQKKFFWKNFQSRKSCKIQLKTWFWSIFWLLSGSIGSGTRQNIFKMILTCKATPNYPTNTLVHANMCENTIFSSTEPSLQKTAVFCRLGSSKTAILSCF